MKTLSIIALLIATSFVNANSTCDSEKNGDGKLLTLKKNELKLEAVKVGDVLLFGNKKVKVADFYTTGGPELGIKVISVKGDKFDIWCTDEETPLGE